MERTKSSNKSGRNRQPFFVVSIIRFSVYALEIFEKHERRNRFQAMIQLKMWNNAEWLSSFWYNANKWKFYLLIKWNCFESVKRINNRCEKSLIKK